MSDTNIAALLSSLITAFLAFGFTKYRNFKDKNGEQIAILNALQSELTSLLSLISSREKDCLEYDSSHLPEGALNYIPITLNYFTVFENLSAKFGLITNKELVSNIISTYAETKGLFENVKDIEYFAKMAHSLMQNPSQNRITLKTLIAFHRNYENGVLNIQVPAVKTLIKICISEIGKAKDKISSKNTLKNFLIPEIFFNLLK